MTTVKIKSLGTQKDEKGNIIPREIELLPYTRRVSRPYKAALMRGIVVDTSQATDIKNFSMELPVTNQLEAEEILIKGLTWLTDAELDAILDEEYQELANAVNAYTNDKKKL